MVLTKLQEALEEINAERGQEAEKAKAAMDRIKALDETREDLIAMISRLNSTSTIQERATMAAEDEKTDQIGHVVEILRQAGKPLHVNNIAPLLSARIGKEIKRTTFEPGLNRHIGRVKRRRIDKFGPSLYGLPEWKSPKLHPSTETDQLSLVS